MRVVHVTPTAFGPGGMLGGGERYPLELARALSRSVDCTLLTFGAAAAAWREPSGLHVRVLPARRYRHGHPAHPVAPGLISALANADVVHVHQFRSFPALVALLSAQLHGQRTAVTDHGMQGSDWGGALQRLVDHFLLVSAYSATEVAAPAARTRVIYGGVDAHRFSPGDDAQREGVLFVGRLTPHKGVDGLLAALPAGARLTIAGSLGHDAAPPECHYGAELRRLAGERDVRFVVPATEAELPGLYRRARVCVLPSVHHTMYGRQVPVSELLGLTLLEAMASGTPVVASRLGGIPEIVEEGVTGFLVPPGDVAALHDRLAWLLAHPRLAAQMGANARARVLERFTWHACAQRCLAAYDALGATPDVPPATVWPRAS